MVTEDDLSLGAWHTMTYADPVSEQSTLETFMLLLTNVTPISLTLKSLVGETQVNMEVQGSLISTKIGVGIHKNDV